MGETVRGVEVAEAGVTVTVVPFMIVPLLEPTETDEEM